MGEPLCTLPLADGRVLAYALWGEPSGFPVIALHGTPGCRLGRYADDDVYRSAGIRYITHDRAGYGRSSRHHGRKIADEAADVAALADALAVKRFGVTGRSGGGPHALACAALLGDRVVRASCHVSPAPLGSTGLARASWFAGMAPENIREWGWAEAGESTLRPELEREYRETVERVARDPSTILGAIEVSASDRANLARPEIMRVISEMVPEMCGCGVAGWIDDDFAFLEPWGFDLASIRVPVLVRYGRGDVLAPPAHGDWLASHVPGAIVRVDAAAGHMGTDPLVDLRADMAWLREGIPPS